MSGIKFNKDQLDRILGKLKTIEHNCKKASGSPVYDLVLSYVTEYHTSIVKAMGSVSVDGGSTTIKVANMTESITWEALSPRTVKAKEEAGLSLSIWQATGETKGAVKVGEVTGASIPSGAIGFFAGISKADNPAAYQKAINSEFGAAGSGFSHDGTLFPYNGGEWPSRPLFTVANMVFMANRSKIREAVKVAVLTGVDWGK